MSTDKALTSLVVCLPQKQFYQWVFAMSMPDDERRKVRLDKRNRSAEKTESRYAMMIQESIPKLIAKLSVPTILSMLISSIYNLVDTAFVGQLGTSQSAAIGVVFGFMAIIQAVGFLFGQGAGSISARMLGGRDEEGATRVASSGIVCSFGLGVVIAVTVALLKDPIVRILGSTETIAPYAKEYLNYILLAAPAMTCSYTMNNLLRYEGRASLGMVGMMVGAILNIALDPLLMFVLDLGIAGAAIATASSQMISFLILIFFMYFGRVGGLTLAYAALRPEKSEAGKLPEEAVMIG